MDGITDKEASELPRNRLIFWTIYLSDQEKIRLPDKQKEDYLRGQGALPMEETKAILGEIDFDNHRASVIVAAGGVNGMLRRILDSFLNEPDTNQDKLLDGRGALSTFGSRIRLCNRLGLIDDEGTKVIDLLRRTRNVFAHEVSAINSRKLCNWRSARSSI